MEFSVPPDQILIPVTVVQGASDRWDVIVTCAIGTCFEMTGTSATASGTREQVEAAFDAPEAESRRIDSVYFPFDTREQAERVAQAMNELLEIQGAQTEHAVSGDGASSGRSAGGS